MKIYRRLLAYARPYRGRMLLAFIAMALSGSLQSAPIFIVKPLLDEIFIAKDSAKLFLIIALLAGAYTLKGLVFYAQHVLTADVGQRIVRDLRGALYRKYMGLPVSFFTGTHSGDLTSRVLNDIQQVRSALTDALMSMFHQGITLIFLAGAVVWTSPRFAGFALVSLPVTGALAAYFGKRLRKYSYQGQERMASLSTILIETIQGIRIVKAFGMENHEIEKFEKTNRHLFRLQMRTVRVTGLSPAFMEWMGALGIALFLTIGGRMVIGGEMTTGDFFAFITAVGLMFQPIKKLQGVNERLQNGLAAAERIFQIMDAENTIQDPPTPRPFPDPIREGVRLEGVRFGYDGGSGVLDGVDIAAPPGRMIALVGSSGAGKTSLVNLLPRFYDVTGGKITVDGVDIREMAVADLRAHIAMVTQETVLFNDTVRANISYGTADRSEAEIRAAAEAASALGFIEAMPEKFDTLIGEHGMTLSGGQRQRVAIARAILKNAPILILDEATSALDAESEREVQRAIDRLVANRTTFVIAHRLSTVRNADQIVVLRNGQVVERGRHEELLRLGGEYERLHRQQFRDDAAPAEQEEAKS